MPGFRVGKARREWHSKALRHDQRRTRRAEALFQGAVSKDMVPLILDGAAIKTRLHRHLGAGGHRRTT